MMAPSPSAQNWSSSCRWATAPLRRSAVAMSAACLIADWRLQVLWHGLWAGNFLT